METQEHGKPSRDKIYWHSAFFEALQLELHQYLDALKFVYEHQLSKEALRIDVLVIKNERGRVVKEIESGIYHVEGETYPIQILENKKLSAETNLFLKNLRSNLTKEEAQRIVDAYKTIKEFESKSAYIGRLFQANEAVFKEVMEMSDKVLQDIFVKAIAEKRGWLDDVYREKERQKTLEIARGLKLDNVPFNIIIRNTGLTLEEVESL